MYPKTLGRKLPDATWQERKLGDEERRDLQNQASALEKELQGSSADASTLKRAAATYSALGEGTKAAGALERLTEAQPDNPEGWQLLVGRVGSHPLHEFWTTVSWFCIFEC